VTRPNIEDIEASANGDRQMYQGDTVICRLVENTRNLIAYIRELEAERDAAAAKERERIVGVLRMQHLSKTRDIEFVERLIRQIT